jgi:hypothetical protein
MGDEMRSAVQLAAVVCAALLSGAALSGCGTTGAENAALLDKALRPAHARLQIHREGIVGAAVPARILIDGREVASIGVGGSTVVDVPAGSRKIVVDSWSHPNAYTLPLAVKSGTLYTLEVSIRGEAMVAGMFGVVGMIAESAANENGGTFQIRVVGSKALRH